VIYEPDDFTLSSTELSLTLPSDMFTFYPDITDVMNIVNINHIADILNILAFKEIVAFLGSSDAHSARFTVDFLT
jgi:hypothetical protein